MKFTAACVFALASSAAAFAPAPAANVSSGKNSDVKRGAKGFFERWTRLDRDHFTLNYHDLRSNSIYI